MCFAGDSERDRARTGRDEDDASRQRLVLLGMPAELIASVESNRQPRTSVTIRSPTAGVVQTLDAREGMSVSSGATIASINGLSSVWLEAAIPEAQPGSVSIAVRTRTRELDPVPDTVAHERLIEELRAVVHTQ